jgi:LPXTG-site transpeptidase (sortase) family protein
MGQSEDGVAAPEVPDAGDSEAAPLGVLWTWTPDSVVPLDKAPERPFAEQVAEVVAQVGPAVTVAPPSDASSAPVGKLWTWEPTGADASSWAAPAPVIDAPVIDAPLFGAAVDHEVTTLRPAFELDPDLVLPAPPPLAPPVFFDALDEVAWPGPHARSRRRRRLRLVLAALLVVVCAALPWAVPQIPDLFASAVPDQSTKAVTDPPVEAPTSLPGVSLTPAPGLIGRRLASAGTPLEVVVPRLHVKSSVVPISGATGELVPPSNPQLLGWWQEGAGVGSANGSAVVTGHTVSVGGGAFDHLGELVPGDRLRVRTAAGLIEYVVTSSRDVRVKKLARDSKEIFRQSGAGRLVLITCSDFNGRVYLSNSVVYATPVKDRPQLKR